MIFYSVFRLVKSRLTRFCPSEVGLLKMLNENKNQKKRCDFDGPPVFLDEIFLLLLLATVLPFHLCLENDWLRMILGVMVLGAWSAFSG